MTSYGQQRTLCCKVLDNQAIKISIGSLPYPWRRLITSSFLLGEHSQERDHLNNELVYEDLSILSASSFTLCIQLFYKDTRRLQSNRAERNVEFVFLLNMKRLVILKQQRKKTDGFAMIRMKQNTKQRLRHWLFGMLLWVSIWCIVKLYLRIYCIMLLGESNQIPYNITLKTSSKPWWKF